MTESIERELKYLVKRNEFYTLKKYLDSSCLIENTVIQTNYYFDTMNYDLKSKGITFRIREINQREYYLTLKVKSNEVINNLHIKKEFNMQISQNDFRKLKNAEDVSIQKDSIKPIDKLIEYNKEGEIIHMIGCLTTKRFSYKIPNFDDPILLDKNLYLNKMDYEIEWETNRYEAARIKIKDIFNELGIIPEGDSISKSKRFIYMQRQLQK